MTRDEYNLLNLGDRVRQPKNHWRLYQVVCRVRFNPLTQSIEPGPNGVPQFRAVDLRTRTAVVGPELRFEPEEIERVP